MRIKNLPSIESMDGSQDALVIEQTDGSEDKSRKVSPAQIKQYVLGDMDEVPTQNSNNPVKSGGIFSTMAVPKYDATNRREYFEGGAAFSGNIDSVPTEGSSNMVASGGTWSSINNAVSYKAGDVIVNENVIVAGVGANANDCYFTLPLNKPVNATTVTITDVTCTVYYGTNQKETVGSGATYTGVIKKCSIMVKVTKGNNFTQNGRYILDFNGTFTFS